MVLECDSELSFFFPFGPTVALVFHLSVLPRCSNISLTDCKGLHGKLLFVLLYLMLEISSPFHSEVELKGRRSGVPEMTVTSKAKKEEAELRKIAKQARTARKEVAAKERRLKLKGKKRQQTDGTDRENISSKPATGGHSVKRQGAIILPEEAAEVRQRLLSDTRIESGAAAPENGGAKRDTAITSSQLSNAAAVSRQKPLLSSSSRVEEPAHSVEVHHKRKQFLVGVALHHVPPQHIDVSGTTATALVVDTCKHTKKYRLVLPMPEGICVDPAQAEYEFDCGVLRCVLPIVGEIPSSLRQERDAMLESIQKQKTLRFRMGEDGELKVRSRRALLGKGELKDADGDDKRRKIDENNALRVSGGKKREVRQQAEDVEDDGADETAGEKGKAEGARNREGRCTKRAREVVETSPLQKAGKLQQQRPLQREEQISNNNIVKKKRKGPDSALEEEQKKALELAKAAGRAAKATLRERVAQAKATQQRMLQRMVNRQNRRETQSKKTRDSFARVLEEQKRQLIARAERTAVATAVAAGGKSDGRCGAKGRQSGGKRVTFAESKGSAEE
ncbi:hypothetical protein, conserved [Trypanosoma brucei gambiense DAL972]|uniref:Uncharacterized protein n=1 Tax=Trypanosoma brucei gambiense (strain MHOM/CI/86/DAL972) TaxID=679716 RepID=C9ZUP3_TRYB9|nr:hypothetical protein, conserved [Trypanosoma brucei gambiense DAL972]CBH13131.1 hypothetical protein, conserved [Trypanosoma brucei gambiense DAL972]|eukprot:XP_011775408.1 hypothetical protein, conserved [Trypanosoma brucei gambiense DAL972]